MKMIALLGYALLLFLASCSTSPHAAGALEGHLTVGPLSPAAEADILPYKALPVLDLLEGTQLGYALQW